MSRFYYVKPSALRNYVFLLFLTFCLEVKGQSIQIIPGELNASKSIKTGVHTSSEIENLSTPQMGEFVFDSDCKCLKVFNGTEWKAIAYEQNAQDQNLIELPLIFHIGHFNESVGIGSNLPESVIQQALTDINTAFTNQMSSTNPNATDTGLRFRLATIDPSGNPLSEPGIHRIDVTGYDDGVAPGAPDIANDQKLGPNETWKFGGNTFWDPKQYVNIWVTDEQYGSAYTTLPRVIDTHPLPGLDEVPTNCTCEPYNEWFPNCLVDKDYVISNTSILVHELGHLFGLLHVFSTNNCESSDFCPDTYSFNNSTLEPCPDNLGSNQRDNYMDYIPSANRTTFTINQKERIDHVFKYGIWFRDVKNSTK